MTSPDTSLKAVARILAELFDAAENLSRGLPATYPSAATVRALADALDAQAVCKCVVGPEWSVSPNPADPDNSWVCDDCGRVIACQAPATPWRERVERAADNITSAFAMIGRDNVAADILAETALRGGFPEHAPTEKE